MCLNINGFIFKGADYSWLVLTASIPIFPARIISRHLRALLCQAGIPDMQTHVNTMSAIRQMQKDQDEEGCMDPLQGEWVSKHRSWEDQSKAWLLDFFITMKIWLDNK